MSGGRVVSTSIDAESGKAKIVLSLDEDEGPEAAKARRRARREALQIVATTPAPGAGDLQITSAKVVRTPIAKPPPAKAAVAKPKVQPMVRPPFQRSPFAKPVQISLDEGEKEKQDKLDKEERKARSRSRKRREKDEARANADQKIFKMASAPMGPGLQIKGYNDLITGGTALGPLSITSLAEGSCHNKTGICLKFLQGECPMPADQCLQKHIAEPSERAKWISYFNTQPCKFGDSCKGVRCIYDHPNRRGWNGQNTNLLIGTSL